MFNLTPYLYLYIHLLDDLETFQAACWPAWLILLLLAAFIFFAFLNYFRQQKAVAMDQFRIQLSADLHDDVGSQLAGLAMQAELLQMSASGEDKAHLEHIAAVSRDAMLRMRDAVWAIDARKDNWTSLLERLNEHAREVLDPRDIVFQIKTEGIECHKRLPSELRRHLYLIGKEAITNVAKHSDADQVTLTMRKTGDSFEMDIRDNGQIFENRQSKATGLGLSNILHRAKAIGGSLKICKQHGFGIVLNMAL